jgi:hypothetical protein
LTGRTIATKQDREQVKVTVADRNRLVGVQSVSLSQIGFGSDAISYAGREKRWGEQFRSIASEELGVLQSNTKLARATERTISKQPVGDNASLVGNSRLELRIVRAEERRGGQIGADNGALASIGLVLRDEASQAIIWEGSYYYRDVALSDNLLGYGSTVSGKSSQGWVNLDEAVYTGMRAALRRLERDRLAAYSVTGGS